MFLVSLLLFSGVGWTYFVQGKEGKWVPIMLSVGFLVFWCVMVCDLMVMRRDTGGVYGKEASPRGAPYDPALLDASAGKHLVGVLDETIFMARKDIGAALAEFREEVRGFREERREHRQEKRRERLERERMSR